MKYILVILIAGLSLHAHSWTVLTTPLPPYSMEGKLQGYAIELTHHLAERMGQSLEVKVTPWARAQHRVKEEGNLLIAPLTRTDFREEHFDWLVPLHDYRLYFVTINPAIDITDIEVIRQYQICALRESPASHSLKKLRIDDVVLFNDDRKCMQLMSMGRISILLAHGKPQAVWSYALEGFDPQHLRFGYSLEGGTLWLASSKGMLTEAEKIQIRRLMTEAKENGFYQTLINRYSIPPKELYQESNREDKEEDEENPWLPPA